MRKLGMVMAGLFVWYTVFSGSSDENYSYDGRNMMEWDAPPSASSLSLRHGGHETALLSTTNTQKDAGNYVPVQCRVYLEQVRSNSWTSPLDDPNEGVLYGKQVTIPADDKNKGSNKFWISLHNQKFDGTRWGIMEYGQYYERA